jgi:hypothetical protein
MPIKDYLEGQELILKKVRSTGDYAGAGSDFNPLVGCGSSDRTIRKFIKDERDKSLAEGEETPFIKKYNEAKQEWETNHPEHKQHVRQRSRWWVAKELEEGSVVYKYKYKGEEKPDNLIETEKWVYHPREHVLNRADPLHELSEQTIFVAFYFFSQALLEAGETEAEKALNRVRYRVIKAIKAEGKKTTVQEGVQP